MYWNVAKIQRWVERFPEWKPLLHLALSTAERARRPKEVERFQVQLGLSLAVAESAESKPKTRRRPARRAKARPKDDAFLASVHAFFRRYYPDIEPPPVVVKEPREDLKVASAVWNSKLDRYEVNRSRIDEPGLAGYVGLMGRFMQLHFARCWEGDGKPLVSPWNQVRLGVVNYLLLTDPDEPIESGEWTVEPGLLDALLELEADEAVTRDGVRTLVLALLESYECDWAGAALRKRIAAVNEKIGTPVPDDALRSAMRRL